MKVKKKTVNNVLNRSNSFYKVDIILKDQKDKLDILHC